MYRLFIVAIVMLVAGTGCATVTDSRSPSPSAVSAKLRTVFVIRRGWHTDVGFAVKDLSVQLANLPPKYSATRFVIFGFGDRRYLTHRGRGSGTLVAAVWPGAGLVLATQLKGSPEEAFSADHVARISVDDSQLHAIEAFIWNALDTAAGTDPVDRGPYEGSYYYASVTRYSGLHTCNTWTAEALQAAGLPIRSAGVEFSGQVWRQVHTLNRQRAAIEASHTVPSRP